MLLYVFCELLNKEKINKINKVAVMVKINKAEMSLQNGWPTKGV